MTRARQTLVMLRAETGRNAYLTDLASLDGVQEALPEPRPTHRPELDRRCVTLGPADVDLGYAGRKVAGATLHAELAALRVGDEIRVADRQLRTVGGRLVGTLSKKCDLPNQAAPGSVFAIMLRTRAQTHPDFQARIKVDAWEVPLVEVTLPAAKEGAAAGDCPLAAVRG
jgi:ATP-dependent DNA helicase RecQ